MLIQRYVVHKLYCKDFKICRQEGKSEVYTTLCIPGENSIPQQLAKVLPSSSHVHFVRVVSILDYQDLVLDLSEWQWASDDQAY